MSHSLWADSWYVSRPAKFSANGVFVDRSCDFQHLCRVRRLIVGGKHKAYRFGIDEHVFAALNVYSDILNLFVRILRIFGKGK